MDSATERPSRLPVVAAVWRRSRNLRLKKIFRSQNKGKTLRQGRPIANSSRTEANHAVTIRDLTIRGSAVTRHPAAWTSPINDDQIAGSRLVWKERKGTAYAIELGADFRQ